MADEYVKNLQYPTREKFAWLEAQTTDINHNVSLLMEALKNNIGMFR